MKNRPFRDAPSSRNTRNLNEGNDRGSLKVALLGPSLFVLFASLAGFSPQTESEIPEHLKTAEQLLQNLKGSPLNVYGGGRRDIEWTANPVTARTVCSSFATLLLEHTYHWDDSLIKRWTGLKNPKAEDYHDAIASQKGFKQIFHVGKIRPGDYLAIKYNDHHVSGNGLENTGHVMLVARAPEQMEPKPPIKEGDTQYSVSIIDSSSSGHGPTDTRHIRGKEFSGGIGRGVIRLYADSDDKIAGYSWTAESGSKFYSAPDRDLVIGRLILPPNR